MSNESKEKKPLFKLNGKLNWVQINKLDNFGKYSFELELDDPKGVQEFLDQNNLTTKIKENKEGKKVLKFAKPPQSRDGKELPKIKAFDSERNEIEELIGNGSVGSVMVTVGNEMTVMGQRHKKIYPTFIVVDELIKYTPDGTGDVIEVGSSQQSEGSVF